MPKTIVHITGTSSGLGHALAETLLENPLVTVYGYSRRKADIHHSNYHHCHVDLSAVDSHLQLKTGSDGEREVLINNAGWIGPVNSIGKLKPGESTRLMTINVSAVVEWTNSFIAQSKAKEKVVISISSGAGKNAIRSWSAYCASKAAIDMATEVWSLDRPDIHFLSIAPGVVDTGMQEDIRKSTSNEFPDIDRFKEMHTEGVLVDPKIVAKQIAEFALWPSKAPANVFSVRDL